MLFITYFICIVINIVIKLYNYICHFMICFVVYQH